MTAHGHRRQVLLFLVAIILPCAVLVVLGLRMLAQERELGVKRVADAHRSITGQLRQELSARLDRIGIEEATALLARQGRPSSRRYRNPAVALVARDADGYLILPWQHDPRAARFRRLLDRGAFAQRVSEGERTEIASAKPGDAAELYARALAVARDPAQVAYARLLRGRAELAAGRRETALRDFIFVLRSARDIVDEHGVPLSLYAGSRFLDAGGHPDAVVDALRRAVGDERWPSPVSLYLARDLAGRVASATDTTQAAAARDVAKQLAIHLAIAERATALQRDFPRLGLAGGGIPTHNGDVRWVAYGDPAWLVGRARPAAGGDAFVVAVRAESLFATVERAVLGPTGSSAKLAVASGDDHGAERLGVAFPGLVARFPTPDPLADSPWQLRRWFYVVALLLVLSVTLFGAYFLSRDVRRELRLAELRSRFVSAVSHELKTPLTAIRMFAETLQLGRSSDPQTRMEYLDTIVNESERLTRLLNNVLDFSRIERGKKEYRRTSVDLGEIVTASARAMRYPLEQQHFTLNVSVEEGLRPVAVDRDAIEQAILNLLANAMKYSGESRVIDLRLTRTDGQVVIEVADRGVGIAVEEQERIFEQFYRVPTKDNDGVPGTGLGLTLVRHIAEGHGGRVTVESAPGRGSTFAIHLPLENGGA